MVTYQIGTAATTITVINATTTNFVGSRKMIGICNPPTLSAGAVTWVGVEWAGSTVPTQMTTAGQCDCEGLLVSQATSTNGSSAALVAASWYQSLAGHIESNTGDDAWTLRIGCIEIAVQQASDGFAMVSRGRGSGNEAEACLDNPTPLRLRLRRGRSVWTWKSAQLRAST
jgi:hypothetical protein